MFRRIIIYTFLIVAFALSTMSISAQMPAIVDRELFFGNPEIAGAQLSPDGKFIAFIKPLNDVRNIWVKGVDEPFDKAKPLTEEKKRPVGGYFWSWNNQILFIKDNGGDENFNVYTVNPADAASGIPAAKNLTNAEKVQTQIIHVPKTEPDFIYIGINDRDPAWHDLYKVKISTGEKILVRKNTDRLTGMIFDNADKPRLSARSTPSGETEILRIDGDKFTKIYSCGVFEACDAIRFHKDNKRFYMATNKGNPDLIQLVLFDADGQKEELVESDPLKRVDFGNASFSEATDELILTTYNDEKTRRYWKDKTFEADYKFLQGKLPNMEITLPSATRDEKLWLVNAYSDTEPGSTYLFDRQTKKLTKQYTVREKLPREALSPMKPIRYKSSDGLEIPAYLTVPKGSTEKNLPLVVVPHGGPWGRDSWGYNSLHQFLANRGYAVLSPNFRASTGYGKKFLDAGNNEWGQKMQDDLTWGVKYLVGQGIADPKRVGIMGGSYGGYATLAGVTYTPDLYAAAVAIVAPSNLNTLLNSIPPYWESIRVMFHKRMGDPTTTEGKAQLERQSPLNFVDKIKTPLMIVQGANDPRVKKAEADQIVIALRDRNYPVEYLLADDEGHGFQRPVNNMAMFAEGEKFLAQYLKGRYQETMTEPVAKRLKELTVDVKTVSMAKKAETNAAPTVNVGGKWNLTADANGMTIPIALELKQDGAAVSGSISSGYGNGSLSDGKISGNRLMGIFKTQIQGQPMDLQIEGTIDGDKMTGTLSGQGLPPISFTATKGN